MKSDSISKRKFLELVTAGAAGACLATDPTSLLAAEPSGTKRKIPIALQLYSVRKDCAKDLDSTLAAVAKIGYKAVEFAGYHGRDAKALRQLLDDVGLKCCGTHIALDTLLGDHLPKTIEFNKTLGNEFLIVPSLPEKYRQTRQKWQEAADLFSELADKVKPHGMRVGYHNHSIEFTPLEGEVPWDIFFSRAKKEVVIQFDTGNGVAQGGDPVVFLKKHPGRVASVHVKPYSKTNPNALLGDDELPWPEIFKLCETVAGVEWYIIEYERENEPPLESVKKLHQIMCRLGKC